MTEFEFLRLRALKQKFRKMLIRDDLEKRYHVVLDDIQSLLDDYLYKDYKETLANPETYNKIKNSKHSEFITHMLEFINKYEKTR